MDRFDVDRIEGRVVVICAPYGRDAEFLASVAVDEGYVAEICVSLTEVARHVDADAGAVVLTEECLKHDVTALRDAFGRQPAWSDLPVLFLAAPASVRRRLELVRSRLPDFLSASVVLERPLSQAALASAMQAALRSRERQFHTREVMRELNAGRLALSQSERELRLVTDSLPVLVSFVDRNLIYRFANREYETWFYRSPSEIVGKRVIDVLGEEAFAIREQALHDALDGKPSKFEVPWPHANGDRRDAEIRYLPRFTESGMVDGFHVFVLDVTDRKTTEEQLEARVAQRTAELTAEMENRALTEAELRQSQKMEAVGQLTGGIAHDFNNMLTGVTGSLEIIKRRIAKGRFDDLDRFMDAAIVSAQRAASLTARLLAFSRRQTLDAKPLDVNALMLSLEELLRRSVRETIELHIVAGQPALWALADENQLESAVLNLAINARDAMPDGGRLTLTTDRVVVARDDVQGTPRLSPGEYISITVADTGVGMPAAILEKIFDPFFTTKPVGQGTGLGLSMVYGFAQQSGGSVAVESEPDKGTQVTLFLKASASAAAAAAGEATEAPPEGEGQTVIIVEDDASVRLLMREVLEELQYRVLEAAQPSTAIRVLASSQTIDLMVSDVGLPEMNGRQLAEVARSHRPELPILFVTGYAENAMLKADFLGTNMAMITKPFTVEVLATKVAEMLGST